MHSQNWEVKNIKNKNLFHANSSSLRQTVRSAVIWCVLVKSTCTPLKTHCLKADCWFANELSWWQVLPFNWVEKETIRIQRIDAHQRSGVKRFLYITFENVPFRVRTPTGSPQACYSLKKIKRNYEFKASYLTALWSSILCVWVGIMCYFACWVFLHAHVCVFHMIPLAFHPSTVSPI